MARLFLDANVLFSAAYRSDTELLNDSVRQWKFEPYTSQGVKKTFCGQVALRFQANEYGVKYKII